MKFKAQDDLYFAEWIVRHRGFEVPIPDPQAYSDHVCKHPWTKKNYPSLYNNPPTINTETTKSRWAEARQVGRKRIIDLPPWLSGDQTILHELAHYAGGRYYDPHNDVWLECYLQLVKKFMGRDAYLCLSHCVAAVGR